MCAGWQIGAGDVKFPRADPDMVREPVPDATAGARAVTALSRRGDNQSPTAVIHLRIPNL